MNDLVTVPSYLLPAVRVMEAHKRGVMKKMLFRCTGGIGDRVCAEPTLRYALREFKDCEISLFTHDPALFSHLIFKNIFTVDNPPMQEDFLIFDTYYDGTHFMNQFVNSAICNAVDYATICSLRGTLPFASKEIKLEGKEPDSIIPLLASDTSKNHKAVYVHPGRSWESRTFPVEWWNSLLAWLKDFGVTPILIGAEYYHGGVLDVNNSGCIDLRGKTSLPKLIWLLKNAKVVLTNDSSPVHISASGDAWIGYVATARHPDHLKHWRHGQLGWRMKSFERGGFWKEVHIGPREQTINFDKATPEQMDNWLPDTQSMAEWAAERLQCNDSEA